MSDWLHRGAEEDPGPSARLPGRSDWLAPDPVTDRRRAIRAARPPAYQRELRTLARVAGWLVVAAIAVAVPSVVDAIWLSILTRALALTVTLLGLQVLLGYGGLLSLGQGAMMGLGAWTAAVLIGDNGLSVELGIPITTVLLALVGAAIGLPALRLSRIGLVLLTLAVSVSFPLLFQKFVGPLGKAYDIADPPDWTGLAPTDDDVWAYGLAVVVAVVAYGSVRLTLSGRFGRSLRAVRDEPQAAAAFGIPVARVRLMAFAMAAGLGGAGGALLLVRTPFVYGPDYPFQLSIQLFAVALLVGTDRLAGALAGGLLLVILPRFLSAIGLIGLEDLVYALVLLAVIVAFRGRGVGGWLDAAIIRGDLGRDRRIPTGLARSGLSAPPPADGQPPMETHSGK